MTTSVGGYIARVVQSVRLYIVRQINPADDFDAETTAASLKTSMQGFGKLVSAKVIRYT